MLIDSSPEDGYAAIPEGARCLPLKPGTKEPATRRGHLDAVESTDFLPLGNYGIALDDQWVVIDFDAADPMADLWREKLPPTWRQQTPRGEHYLFRVPLGWSGTNRKIIAEREGARRIIGDVKARGYIVGPGSSLTSGESYIIRDGREPAPAPAWLLEFAVRREEPLLLNGVATERGMISDGERDNELTAFAGYLRRKGFTGEAIVRALNAIVDSGLVEQPPGREVTQRDTARIARSVSKYAPGDDLGELLGPIAADAWVCGSTVQLVGPPKRWWVRGFVPQSELVMLYGRGGVGKSSFASWLAAEVTCKGATFVYAGVEEPFERFLMRAVLMGADRSLIYSIPHASALVLPRDVPGLRAALETAKTGVLYFDSIYSHFATSKGENTAERARRCLGPLAEMAQETGTTVIGVFHENKAGDYLGSVEMVNVARYVLKATRDRNKPMKIAVDKTNIWDPRCMMTFEGREVKAVDPQSGDVQLEEQADGTLGPLMVTIVDRGLDFDLDAIDAEDLEPLADDPEPKDPKRLARAKRERPGIGNP